MRRECGWIESASGIFEVEQGVEECVVVNELVVPGPFWSFLVISVIVVISDDFGPFWGRSGSFWSFLVIPGPFWSFGVIPVFLVISDDSRSVISAHFVICQNPSQCGHFWVILGSFWVMSGRYPSMAASGRLAQFHDFWPFPVVSGHFLVIPALFWPFWSFLVIFGRFGSFWVICGRFGSFRVVLVLFGHSGTFLAILGHFGIFRPF